MKRLKRLSLLAIACITSIVVIFSWHPPIHSQEQIRLQASPALEQVVPATDPVRLTLTLVDENQQPLPNAKVQVKLFTPPKTPWFTSDFPIVEGTQLLDLTDIATNGELTIAPVLPVRGSYRLDVAVTPETTDAFRPFAQSLTFSVPENPVKYRNVAILIAILLLAGLGSGWILGGDQTVQPGEIAPRPVRMMLSLGIILAIVVLLVINISAELASAHGEAAHDGVTVPAAVQQSQGIRAELSGDITATVGKMAAQTVAITDAAGNPFSEVNLRIQVVGLEHDELVFSHKTKPDAKGVFSWQEQFFDGAPHQITVDVTPLAGSNQPFAPFQVAHPVEVEGIAPPLPVRLIGLLYFTAVYVLGLGLGFLLHRRVRQVPVS